MPKNTNGKEETHTLILMPSGRHGEVEHDTTVLEAARQLGVEIESICGGRQTCEKCRVIVEEGHFDKHGITSSEEHLSAHTPKEIELLEKLGTPEQRLSCNAHIRGDVLITVPEGSRAKKQIIRKTATVRTIEIAPVVRQIYVEVDVARLGEHRGDWGRLQDALAEQWNLKDLDIDLQALRRLQATLRKKDWAVTATIWNEREVIDIQPGYQEGAYGLAVDVGSTTVASYLCDLRTGELLATESMMNPQVSFGEDLMSRISFAMNRRDGLDKMHKAILDTINTLASRAARAAGIRSQQIHEITLAGNTTMTHILLGINPVELGGAPFALANRDAMDIKARELGLRLHPGAYAHILPSQAGHVGADNVGVLIAEQPYLQDRIILTVDVGTNAEIVLSSKDWMYSASSPTGPAFEGGQISAGMRAAPGAIERVRIDSESKLARFRVIGEERWSDAWQLGADVSLEAQPKHLAAGICGSGIIEVVAELFLAELLTPDGRFNPKIECASMQWDQKKRQGAYVLATADQTSSGKPLLITQNDVRNIQLAKAALYAGAKLLMMRANVDSVDEVILAGAFGNYIDPKHASILGLIPDCDLEKVHAVGNAAGDGARIVLLNRQKRAEAQQIAYQVRYIETAVDEDFQNEFVKAMHIPHQSDPYPHLEGILPKKTTLPLRRERRHRRSRRTTVDD
ncbi:MAG TPA: ASKHA domain-containing protein [Anaerolineales bacterium]|nr:ASKHA domain-containing protein [Anaerolineales bacterium]